jgi:hypothetical protein
VTGHNGITDSGQHIGNLIGDSHILPTSSLFLLRESSRQKLIFENRYGIAQNA